MKKEFGALLASMLAIPAGASELAGLQSYFGPVKAVAIGFFGHVGVELADGYTCRGRRQVVLLTSNPRYQDILAILITAQSANSNIKLYALHSQKESFGFCTIGEAAIGNFSVWPD